MSLQFGLLLLAVCTRGVSADSGEDESSNLRLPALGDHRLRALTPELLELTLITTKAADVSALEQWDFVAGNGQLRLPPLNAFRVQAGNRLIQVAAAGFKRRPVYAPLRPRDLRLGNWLFLKLAQPIPVGQSVRVDNPDGQLWPATTEFATIVAPSRVSPAIHVNQCGYLPDLPKVAMVGMFLGSLGEMDLPSTRFHIVSTDDQHLAFEGALRLRRDEGFNIQPKPYQKVWEADFSGVTNSGRFRLEVDGLGRSAEFGIDAGVAAEWTRTAALGLYHQRCGASLSLPYTRFTHGVCHTLPAEVPTPQFKNVEKFLAGMTADATNNPRNTAPALSRVNASLYPYANPGPVEVSGGHHDAGDYSKYTINSAAMIHFLVFAADAFPGVAALDNLGIPESQDGKSDLLQEAKWEADFLMKMQDADGGFYFLVYPRNRKYEDNVPPDRGDPQVVYPKNTSATAAAVAALAQLSSSPAFRKESPEASTRCAAAALRGWAFLEKAFAEHGRDGAYQKLTHYGDAFMHDDELAWAATELLLATGDPKFETELKTHFNPTNPATRQWTWWRLYEGYGCAVRSYAFAARTGRLPAGRLDPDYLARCETELKGWADEEARFADECAYGTSFPDANKRLLNAGWYFSSSRAFDLAVAWQLEPRSHWLKAMLGNLNFELGNNPVNVCFLTGLGTHPARELVCQVTLNSSRRLPPSGLFVGNLQSGFPYLDRYGKELGALTFPPDGAKTDAYPLYDRWSETFNTATEAVIVDQSRSLAMMAFLMAQTPLREQPWHFATGRIIRQPAEIKLGAPARFNLIADGIDLSQARIAWETADTEPATGSVFHFKPMRSGKHTIEAEAVLPDGRRVFATTEISVAGG
jgi:hypothetical protein